jgi:hypothetical protein
MIGKRIAIAAVLLAMLTLGLTGPASAGAATEGRLTLEIDRGLRFSLNREGAKLRGLKPALGRAGVINLPVEGGGVEYSGKGRLVTAGGLQFAAKGRRATFRDLVLDTAFGTLSAKLGGRRLALATVSGLSSERQGFAVVLELRRLTLTKGAARAIDSSLGIPGLLRPGQALASATGVGRAERIPVLDGRTQLDFGDPFFEKLRALKVNTKPIGNAWVLGTYFAIPDTVGEVALDFSGGRVASDDGVALKQFESNAALDLHNVEYDFAAGVVRAGITTRYTLPSEARVTPLARFRVSVTHKNAYTGELSAAARGTLTSAFADRLNEAFAEPKGLAPPFAGGEPLTIAFGLQTRR